jgi:hypothetical protein
MQNNTAAPSKNETERHSTDEPMDDPLRLHAKDPANAVRFARAAPHPDVERIYRRITTADQADSTEVRLLLLAHLVYVAYRDLKETVAL